MSVVFFEDRQIQFQFQAHLHENSSRRISCLLLAFSRIFLIVPYYFSFGLTEFCHEKTCLWCCRILKTTLCVYRRTFKGFTVNKMIKMFLPKLSSVLLNQRTNGPVNAHLISGPRISTQYAKPGKQKVKKLP